MGAEGIHLLDPKGVGGELAEKQQSVSRGDLPPGRLVGESRIVQAVGLESEAKLSGSPHPNEVAEQDLSGAQALQRADAGRLAIISWL